MITPAKKPAAPRAAAAKPTVRKTAITKAPVKPAAKAPAKSAVAAKAPAKPAAKAPAKKTVAKKAPVKKAAPAKKVAAPKTVAAAPEYNLTKPYKFLTGLDDGDFCTKVSAHLNAGYVLVGGGTMTTVGGKPFVGQAVFKASNLTKAKAKPKSKGKKK